MPKLTTRHAIWLPALAAAMVSLAGPVIGQPKTAEQSATAQSMFVGRWELDLTRMPANYGPPPKQVVFTFQPVSSGELQLTVDITAPDETHRLSTVTCHPNGTAAVASGNTSEADSAAIMIPLPSVLVLNLVKNKMLGSVRVYILSPQGEEMTESAAAVDDKGNPFIRNFHFKRIG